MTIVYVRVTIPVLFECVSVDEKNGVNTRNGRFIPSLLLPLSCWLFLLGPCHSCDDIHHHGVPCRTQSPSIPIQHEWPWCACIYPHVVLFYSVTKGACKGLF